MSYRMSSGGESSAYRRLLGVLALSLSFTPVSGCGDDEPQRSMTRGVPAHLRRGGGNTNSPSGGGTPAQQAQQAAPATLPEKLRRQGLLEASGWIGPEQIRNALSSPLRDPFLPDLPELQMRQDVRADRVAIEQRLQVTLPLSPRELDLEAVITGTAVHQAMLSDSSGRGHFVRVGDIIGKSPDFVRVSQITATEILFEPIFRLEGGSEADRQAMLRKTLRGEGEGGEVAPQPGQGEQ